MARPILILILALVLNALFGDGFGRHHGSFLPGTDSRSTSHNTSGWYDPARDSTIAVIEAAPNAGWGPSGFVQIGRIPAASDASWRLARVCSRTVRAFDPSHLHTFALLI